MYAKTTIFSLVALCGCTLSDADLEGTGTLSLEASVDESAVDVFEVGISGTATLAYLSDNDASIDVSVNGNSVYSESFDTSETTDIAFSAVLPLDEGENEIVTSLTYNGNVLTDTDSVTVSPAAPTVEFPTWTQAYSQTGDIQVTVASGWAVDEIQFSRDGGALAKATSAGEGVYQLALADLDIGDNELVVYVTTSNLGHQRTYEFRDTVANVLPVFDCTDSSSMSPTSTLIQNNNTETRTMLGYFGDPDGGHTVSFVITFVDDNNDTYVNPGTTILYGRTAIETELNVGRFSCNESGCAINEDYALEVFVDGVSLCSEPTFGIIRDF